jgi:hypothetical protein
VHGQPVPDDLGRLVRPLQGAGDDRPTPGTTGCDVLRRHHHRRRPHPHVLPQVLSETDLLTAVARNELRVVGGHAVDEVDEASVAVDGALVERVLTHHVGGGQQEQIRLRVTLVGRASLMGGDAPARGPHRCSQVRPHRTPRELRHRRFPPRSAFWSGQGTRRTGPFADSNGLGHQKKSRPAQLTGDNRIGNLLRDEGSNPEFLVQSQV